MRTRMVPVSTITDQLQRAVRDLARTQGKEVDWEVRGGDTELDRSVLAQLTDSLVQLVRNAVDTGSKLRKSGGPARKPPTARIALHAMQLGSEVTITVTDDGRGIDAERYVPKPSGGRRHLRTVGGEACCLIFRPGLSTTSFVTESRAVASAWTSCAPRRRRPRSRRGALPGRGRGPSSGSSCRSRSPYCAACSSKPAECVSRCRSTACSFAAGPGRGPRGRRGPDARRDRRSSRTRVRPRRDPRRGRAHGQGVSWCSGTPLTGTPSTSIGSSASAMSCSRASAACCRTCRSWRVRASSPDGTILIVLDPPGLIQRARRGIRQPLAPPEGAAEPDATRHRILVVDDALTVRELQRGILERAGFEVRVASDGNAGVGAAGRAAQRPRPHRRGDARPSTGSPSPGRSGHTRRCRTRRCSS